ncbi:lamin-like protein [Zingiber officinale]|uniref:Phytocyanin domain-containing protein n=1 Tax=Zingiber officinale TaxID=94328 RepID=A0A8J5KA86_ZINOF|nr:lamin-like protein [Zingiber officinale]KAG6478496.1 hypothetical protein ZIOFF_061939 [Zingiber officinale]
MDSTHLRPLLFLFLSAAVAATFVSATDHIVGANHGWNPNINYTPWANNQTFYVGDLISFRYQKQMYNVFEVNRTGYDNCTMDGLAGNWSSGKDFIPLNEAKVYYFICGNGYCLSGMKVSVTVHSLNASSPSSSAAAAALNATDASHTHGSAAPRLCTWPPAAATLLTLAAVAWLGI